MIRKYFATDFTVGGRVELDAAGGIKSMKELKQSIKDAQLDLINMQERFGETSKEAINAARRVNELKDKIKDAAEVTDLFDPGKKFQAATNAINGLVGGFTALTGAMSLLGVESDNVQKQLLKVQSALALSQGLSTIADSAKDFKRLGDTIVNTLGRNGLIGVAIAGVAALGAALLGVFDSSKKVTAQQQALNDVSKEAAGIYAKERLELENNKRALESENTSRDEKRKIINKLQEQYPGYFNNLDIEGGKVVGLAEDYNVLIKVIGLKARATAAANLLAKQEEELLAQGFEFGITSEEQAMEILKRLEASDDVVSTLAAQKGREILARRKFLQDIQAESNEQVRALQGNRVPTPTPTPGGGGRNEKPKEDEAINFGEGEFDSDGLSVQQRLDLAAEENYQKRKNKIVESFAKNKRENIKFFQDLEAKDQAEANQKKIDDEQRLADQKVLLQRFVANQTAIFSDIIGRETAAGKVLAVASATINTYLAATQALKADYSVYGPASNFVRIATVVSTIALGLKQVREIVKTQVPGRPGGGSSPSAPSLSSSAPLSPQAQTTSTLLNQNQLNQIGNAAVRAFVVESDVTTNQERIRMLNRRARL